MDSVDFAIIPAAGKGSRWDPISSFVPKEMLPLNGTPVIELVIREAIESNVKKIIIVINKEKEVIRNFINSRSNLNKSADFYFVYQDKPLGVIDAVYRARSILKGKNFALLFPDMPSYYQQIPPLKQTLEIFNALPTGHSVLSFAKYPQNNMLFYGEFLLKKRENHLYDVLHLCPRAKTPTDIHHLNDNLRGAGRNIFSFVTFPLINQIAAKPFKGEISDANLLNLMFEKKIPIIGKEIDGFIFDAGTPELFAKANWFATLQKKKL
ncbi:NTP transferase domain-containing protein [Candidatus Microgenomates bacterium]|nr:NTP transferase domain-containing protein [Candidatus Microgenomates bacterium]